MKVKYRFVRVKSYRQISEDAMTWVNFFKKKCACVLSASKSVDDECRG